MSLDKKRIVSGSSDSKVIVWDWKSKKEVETKSKELVTETAENKDGVYEIKQILYGPEEDVWSVAMSKDNSTIVSGSTDTKIRV
mmetsp:Transcript_52976/g.115698  ORF Transcript_52976/g.115698 Transcript_52976/m.115698 type:complete len:84 (+) Transcript_52976:397-648(+)